VPQNYQGTGRWAENDEFLRNFYSLNNCIKNLSLGMHGYFHNNAIYEGCYEYVCKGDYFNMLILSHLECGYDKILRPPGWWITYENVQRLTAPSEFNITLAGHPSWYTNLAMWGVDQTPVLGYNDGQLLVLHSHANENCGQNNINCEKNFANLTNYINLLQANYELNWISSINLYKMAQLKESVCFTHTEDI
jgi:hypothetical protein